ncbi:hypothetical protein [Rheinheimera nanhaiensis]|uniref:Uncharacterized protein n=1 Tax=Rheinheimera nanhaiensis E407-8 TaxID=562729 RepID=I1DX69_9GAMM|nr:hypothetical protein [Rheinheimera nanhaiensis]GAB58647.1 hypothetical protein RNAN_1627 [Rheinheimera nanhaiensis E407-8]
MSISNIGGNSPAQAQFYAQEKVNALSTRQDAPRAEAAQGPAAGDSVQISEQARALLQREQAVTAQGNGGGIIPPGNAPVTGSATPAVQGNGGGIIPPGNAPVTGSAAPAITTLGNGGGIIPPGN